VVGDLQKSGVYHVANANTMDPVWTAPRRAFLLRLQRSLHGVRRQLDLRGRHARRDSVSRRPKFGGEASGVSPLGDGTHYQSTSAANGVAWTFDGDSTSMPSTPQAARRWCAGRLSVDAGAPVTNLTSSGIAIAEHQLFVAAGGSLL